MRLELQQYRKPKITPIVLRDCKKGAERNTVSNAEEHSSVSKGRKGSRKDLLNRKMSAGTSNMFSQREIAPSHFATTTQTLSFTESTLHIEA